MLDHRVVQVPVSLLLDSSLSASAKVVWMARRLDAAATPSQLEAQTGLSRNTVQSGLAKLARHGRTPAGPRVKVPAALLAEGCIGAQAKVLYGILQATPGYCNRGGEFTYASLSDHTGLNASTLKKAVTELAQADWLRPTQENRRQPIQFKLGSPELFRSQAEVDLARRRFKRAPYDGEALMQEYLSLLIDSADFSDNARPGFLVNPQTGERLELDRYYPPNVAFEFNGAQHYQKTGRFTQAEADAQHFRDLVKAGLCLYLGIHLVVVHPEDLSLQGMRRKVGSCMPLRDLTGHDSLIEWLEEESMVYWAPARPKLS